MHIAQMNVGTVLYETDDPRMADFMNNLDRVNALAEASPGFVWRLTGEGNNATDIRPADDPLFLVNMSVWASVAALFDFVYRSDHRGFMVRRREWFAEARGAVSGALVGGGRALRRPSRRGSRGSAISPSTARRRTPSPSRRCFPRRERADRS